MIILRMERVVILTPPRTASVSLHAAICGQNAPLWVNGPIEYLPNVPMAHETRNIPPHFADCRLFCTVRRPLHRLVSLYCLVRDWRPRLPAADWSFADFVERAAHPPAEGWWPAWGRSISDYLRPLRSVDGVLRHESLATDLRDKLGLRVVLPHLNRSARRWYAEYYADPRVLELARGWAEEDCRVFGYPNEP